MKPYRLRELARAIRALGGDMIANRGGSSHFKFIFGSHSFPISAHNGERQEISAKYIRTMCEALEINEQDFRRALENPKWKKP